MIRLTQRFVASGIDWILYFITAVVAAQLICTLLYGMIDGLRLAMYQNFVKVIAMICFVLIAYISERNRFSPGMKLFRLKVVDSLGEEVILPWKSLVRAAFLLIFPIDLIVGIFTVRHTALSDMISKTRVLLNSGS